MEKGKIKYMPYFETLRDVGNDLTNEQLGELVRVLSDYFFDGKEPQQCSLITKLLFKTHKVLFDNSKNRYNSCIENGRKGAEYGKNGGRPKKKTSNLLDINEIDEEKNPKENPKKNPYKNTTTKNDINEYENTEKNTVFQNVQNFDNQINNEEEKPQKNPIKNKNKNNININSLTGIKRNSKEMAQNSFAPPSLEETKDFFYLNGLNGNAETFFDYYESNGWIVGKTKMKNWQAAARNWSRREQQAETQKQTYKIGETTHTDPRILEKMAKNIVETEKLLQKQWEEEKHKTTPADDLGNLFNN